MPRLSIVLFLCNWGPHAAFQALQDAAAPIPEEIRMVRIPCTGRISKALLFKPFELGADGVILAGCEPGSCRYGMGTETALNNVEETRAILDLLGLGRERLRLGTFLPEESGRLLEFLEGFCGEMRHLGPSPTLPQHPVESMPDKASPQLSELLRRHDVYACQDCGKCTSACPLALAGKPFSPRSIATDIIAGNLDDPRVRQDIWSCLTCGLCLDRCPSAVDFPAFIRDLRPFFHQTDAKAAEAHGGFFQSLMRTMTSPELTPRHWDWLPSDLVTDHHSPVLFFGGCAPYFDIFFRRHLKVRTREILTDAIRLLNFFDIHPALLPAERCCGHDLLWTGDRENFLRLARLNAEAIAASGAEEIITACPECYRTLATDYPAMGIRLTAKVTHLFDRIEAEVDKGGVEFRRLPRRITFQDPCRLSRLENRPDLPRKLLARLQPKAFTEMPASGNGALCCGNSAWTGCDAYSKALQVRRLNQVRETGSDLLVTACPKCQIHLRCAMEDPFRAQEIGVEMADLTSVLARTIVWS